MSKDYSDINRLMGANHEISRRNQYESRKWRKKRQRMIKDALDRLDDDDNDTSEATARTKAVYAFEEKLEEHAQARHDVKYHNGQREDTYVAFVLIGKAKRRDGSEVYLYGTVVENALRTARGKERNERDEDGKKKKYTGTRSGS